MKSIDLITQTVEKLEQDSLALNKNDSRDRIDNLIDFAKLTLPTLKVAKNDIKNFEYSKVYDKLEQKVIEAISRLESL